MALILPVNGKMPVIGKCFLAPNCTIVGDVTIADECSVWFNAVIRGDVNRISIGYRTNIQDGAIIHCTFEKAATIIGKNVSIGHNAIVHGCVIEDNVLVGMGSIIMDHAHIGTNSIIAAGAVVLEHTIVEPASVYAGIPAKKVKDISEELIKDQIERIAKNYTMYSSWFKEI